MYSVPCFVGQNVGYMKKAFRNGIYDLVYMGHDTHPFTTLLDMSSTIQFPHDTKSSNVICF